MTEETPAEADPFTSWANSKIQLALTKLREGDLAAASSALQGVLAVAPHNHEILLILAEVAFFTGRTEQSINALITAIEVDFNPIGQWNMLERVLAPLGEHEVSKFAFLRERLKQCTLPSAQLKILVDFLLHKLGYQKAASRERVGIIFRELVMPWLQWALDTDRFNLALHLERCVYVVSIKQTETEQNFRNVISQLVEPMCAAGRRLAAGLPKLHRPEPAPLWRVTLLLHSASMLAHVKVMLGMLDGYSTLDYRPIAFNVICLSSRNQALEAELSRIGIPLTYFDALYPEIKKDRFQAMIRLREHLGNIDAHAVVWVSMTQYMPFAFSLRIAPVQIWWAMKYHSIEFDEIDAYLTGASFSKYVTINNRTWRSARSQVNARRREGIDEEVASIRKGISGGNRVILGTLAREEKIASPAFLDAICTLLKKHDNVVYIWTGREKLPLIRDRFIKAGVLEQTLFLGWIDTSIYAQVIDIFLDTFPAGCGLTVWEAMAAGKPVIFMASDGRQGDISLDQLIWPLLNGEGGSDAEETRQAQSILGLGKNSLHLRAHDAGEYVQFASRLIDDAEFRESVARAGQKFVTDLLCNQTQTGRDYRDHFVEILEEHYSRECVDVDH